MHPNYRPEIDGLRTIAVLSVLIYHLRIDWFSHPALSGGFLGVDIFFVISGYLIGHIVISEIAANKFSIRVFYRRRARRIFPALFVMISATIPAAWILLSPKALLEYSGSTVSSVFFYSNFLFWLEDSYVAEASKLKPLLHTWSLAIEEQFYIFLPPLILLLFRISGKTIFPALLAIFFSSLLWAQWQVSSEPTAAFYLLPSRAWELAAGTILAQIHISRGRPPSNRFSGQLAMLGLMMILLPLFVFTEAIAHPSLITLIPVLGTVIIIHVAGGDDRVTRLLSSKPMIGIGLRSYSLYLWHWPVIAFANIAVPESTLGVKLGLALISVLLAQLSYQFIERPFRNQSVSVDRVYTSQLALALIICLFAGTATLTSGFKFRLDDDEILRATEVDRLRWRGGDVYIQDCYYQSKRVNNRPFMEVFPFQECIGMQNGKYNVLLIGDSTAAKSVYWGLRSAFNDDVHLSMTAVQRCRAAVNSGKDQCRIRNDYIFKELKKNPRDLVIISGLYYLPKQQDELLETLLYLDTIQQPVIVIGPSIRFEQALPDIYSDITSSDGDLENHDLIDARRILMDARLKKSLGRIDTQYISLIDEICASRKLQSCKFLYGNVLLTPDRAHLSPTAARDIFTRYHLDRANHRLMRDEKAIPGKAN